MAGFIKVEAKRLPTKVLNMQINKEIFYKFKVKCKEQGMPLNVVIEVFMKQYGNRRYHLDKEDILKWKGDNRETETLNSTFNKEVYNRFKDVVKYDGYFIKHVISAFVEDYVKRDLIVELTENHCKE